MNTIDKIGKWIASQKTTLIRDWLSNQEIIDIFKKHKISLSKFAQNYAPDIINHTIAIMQNQKEMQDCPVMNKFVDLMLKKSILSHEIFIICMLLRRTVLDNLLQAYPNFANAPLLMQQTLKIFDTNLIGVFRNFDEALLHKNLKYKKEIQNLKDLFTKDSLTNLKNFNGFEQLLEKKLKNSDKESLKILMLELKGFTLFKEQYPKKESEKVLQNVADVITRHYPEESAILHSGNFAIINNNLTLEDSQKLSKEVEDTIAATEHTNKLSVHAAIVLFHDDDTPMSLISRGEILLGQSQGIQNEMVVDENIIDAAERK
jgi:GGDEF domain-containing protein